MLKQLIKIRFLGLLNMMGKKSAKSGKKGSTTGRIILMSVLYIYVMVVFGFVFGAFFMQLAAFEDMGFGWVYFSLYAAIAFVLMLVGSAAIAKTQIFDAKDNDLLLSMPISPLLIIISRVMMLLITNLLYFLSVLIPACAVWAVTNGFSIIGLISFIVLSAALWLFSTACGVFMGWVIALISRRARNKTLVTVIFTLAFLAIYFYFYASAQKVVAIIIQNGADIAGGLKAFLPIYWFGTAISDGNILNMLLAAVVLVIPFIAAFLILSKTFNKIVSDAQSTVRIKEKRASYQAYSPKKALLRHEISRVMSSAPYLVNSGLGVIMGIAAAVFIIIKRETLTAAFAGVESGITAKVMLIVITLGGIFMIGMIYFTSATISMEGKSIWVLKSLPVSTKDILTAKLKLHIFTAAPVALSMWLAANICAYNGILFAVYTLAIITVYLFLTAGIGLFENLRHPILDWQDEAVAVKSGASVMFTMLINMAITFVPGLSLFLIASKVNIWMILAVWLLLAAGLTVLLYKWIMTKGIKRFEEL